MAGLRVSVVSPERVLYEGEASAVVVPAYDGLVGILPRHAPMLALLGEGTMRVTTADGGRSFSVSGGFVQVRADAVRVVTERGSDLGAPGSGA